MIEKEFGVLNLSNSLSFGIPIFTPCGDAVVTGVKSWVQFTNRFDHGVLARNGGLRIVCVRILLILLRMRCYILFFAT